MYWNLNSTIMINEAFKTTKEFTGDAKQALIGRIKNTIFVFYIIAFPICNWDIFLFAFTQNVDAIGKISYIKSILNENYLFRILTPLTIAVFSPLVFTWIQTEVNHHTAALEKDEVERMRKEQLSAAEHRREFNDILTGNRTTEELLTKIAAIEAEKEALNGDIKRLSEHLSNYVETSNEKSEEIQSLQEEIFTLKSYESSLVKEIKSFCKSFFSDLPDDSSISNPLSKIILSAINIELLPLNGGMDTLTIIEEFTKQEHTPLINLYDRDNRYNSLVNSIIGILEDFAIIQKEETTTSTFYKVSRAGRSLLRSYITDFSS